MHILNFANFTFCIIIESFKSVFENFYKIIFALWLEKVPINQLTPKSYKENEITFLSITYQNETFLLFADFETFGAKNVSV